MIEPENHTAWVDRFGDTWVRDDDHPGAYGSWWSLTDGPAWEAGVRGGIGTSRGWGDLDGIAGYGPFTAADPERTARALERVRRQVDR